MNRFNIGTIVLILPYIAFGALFMAYMIPEMRLEAGIAGALGAGVAVVLGLAFDE